MAARKCPRRHGPDPHTGTHRASSAPASGKSRSQPVAAHPGDRPAGGPGQVLEPVRAGPGELAAIGGRTVILRSELIEAADDPSC